MVRGQGEQVQGGAREPPRGQGPRPSRGAQEPPRIGDGAFELLGGEQLRGERKGGRAWEQLEAAEGGAREQSLRWGPESEAAKGELGAEAKAESGCPKPRGEPSSRWSLHGTGDGPFGATGSPPGDGGGRGGAGSRWCSWPGAELRELPRSGMARSFREAELKRGPLVRGLPGRKEPERTRDEAKIWSGGGTRGSMTWSRDKGLRGRGEGWRPSWPGTSVSREGSPWQSGAGRRPQRTEMAESVRKRPRRSWTKARRLCCSTGLRRSAS